MAFIDYIPEGDDTGAIGKGGYIDYVPTPPLVKKEVPKEPVTEEKIEQVVKQAPKRKKK